MIKAANKIKKYGIGIVNDLNGSPELDLLQTEEFLCNGKKVDALVIEKDGEYKISLPEEPMKALIKVLVKKDTTAKIVELLPDVLEREVLVQVYIEEGSKLEYISLQNSKQESYLTTFRELTICRNSEVNLYQLELGSKNSRSAVQANLIGQNSAVYMKTVMLADGEQVQDIYTEAVHEAPRTISKLEATTVLTGKSKGIYRGKIKVENSAKAAKANQRQKTILLSPKAEIDAVPVLDIHTNELECTHGVSVSRPSKESTFYLQSRGISKEQAQEILVQAAVAPMIEKIESQEIVEQVNKKLEQITKT